MVLSSKQMEYLALAWQCFESEPKIDYEKFKSVAGLKTAASARELMRVTKNKLRDEYGALSGSMKVSNALTAGTGTPTKSRTSTPVKNGGSGVKKTPGGGRQRATPGGKKGKKVEVDEDDAEVVNGEVSDEESPSKKAKKYDFAMAEGVKAEPVEEDEDEGEMFH